MKVFYHNDLDGKCAGHIVGEYHTYVEIEEFTPKDFIEMNYGKEFPFDVISKGEKVYIVDYHIKPEEMERLLEITEDIVWVDHHITAINQYKNFPKKIKGIRETGRSGCVLTQQYLYPGREVPQYILLVGDRDVWHWVFGKKTKRFTDGSECYDLHPLSKNWDLASELSGFMEAGRFVGLYKAQRNKEYVEQFGYRTEFESHEAIVVNQGMVGSDVFDDIEDLPPLQIMYVDAGDFFKISLRSTEVNVAALAQKYGGGGHFSAAGMECTKLPWKRPCME